MSRRHTTRTIRRHMAVKLARHRSKNRFPANPPSPGAKAKRKAKRRAAKAARRRNR